MHWTVSRRQALRLIAGGSAGVAASLFGVPNGLPSTGTVDAATSVPDAWSSLVTLRTADGWYASPVHATLMPDGRVVCIGIERSGPDPNSSTNSLRRSGFRLSPSPLGAPLPAEVVIQSLVEPLDANNFVSGSWLFTDDLLCTGNTLTSDGKLFTVGGTRAIVNSQTADTFATGLSYATLFDGQQWSRVGADMHSAGFMGHPWRWYPTATRLTDGRILVTSGFEVVKPNPSPNLTAEIYNPSNGTWSQLAGLGAVPFEILNSEYTHVAALPRPVNGADLLMLGEPGVPVLTSSTGSAWVDGAPRPGSDAWQAARIAAGGSWDSTNAPDSGASTTLLPLRLTDGEFGYANGSVLVTGGPSGSAYEHAVDVYDPVVNRWRPTVQAPVSRHFPTTVLLPDGRVLIIAGHEADPGITFANYVDPAAGFASSLGQTSGTEIRGYHSVAVLLPDGSVLVGGGRDLIKATTGEKPSVRYYYPSYMFTTRPAWLSAPTTIQLGTGFLTLVGGNAPREMHLISLPSMTHSFNMDQRMVQLNVVASVPDGVGHFLSIVMGPPDAHVAPPGYYMLFAVDASRIPSKAAIVQVLPAAGASAAAARTSTTALKPHSLTANEAQSIVKTLTLAPPRTSAAGAGLGPRPTFFCPISNFVYDR